MNTYTLIKTADNHYILTSDEDINESIDSIWYGVGEDNSVIRRKAYTNITFTDEVAKEVGYVDIDAKAELSWRIGAEEYIPLSASHVDSFRKGYLQAIEDNKERRYTEADIKEAFYEGFEKCKNDDGNCFTAWRESAPALLTLPTQWQVEIEMENYSKPEDGHSAVHKDTRPKITNNSVNVIAIK